MKPALLTVALLCGCCAAGAVTEQPPAERPPAPKIAPVSAESLFKQAQLLTDQKQVEQAINAWQQGLALAPANLGARLHLAALLMQQRRAGQAVEVLRPALQNNPDVATFEALLGALRAAGSPIDLAMTAEEAVAKHPSHTGFLLTATEAMLGVKANAQAMPYWQKLPAAEQAMPRSQWLLGAIYEAQAQPTLAWAAYTKAAPVEPRAKVALQRLSKQAVELSGWRYFAPADWLVMPGDANTLEHTTQGARASFQIHTTSTVNQAAQAAIAMHFPLPPTDLAALQAQLTAVKPDAQALFEVVRMPSPCADASLCLRVGPSAAFAGSLPEIHIAVLAFGTTAVTISIDTPDRDVAARALATLSQKTRFVPGAAP